MPLTLAHGDDTAPLPIGQTAWPADRVDRRPVSDLIRIIDLVHIDYA
jgi:hypothetical protein